MVNYTFFEWNYCVICDCDVLRANLRTTLCDVTVSNSVRLFEVLKTIFGVEWVHLQGGIVDEISRSNELFVKVMVTDDVADVLTEKTFNTLSEFLDPVYVLLRHSPTPVFRIG